MISPDGQNGRALFKGSKNSTIDKGMIISKAAKIIRKSNFENVEIFDRKFFEKQNGQKYFTNS